MLSLRDDPEFTASVHLSELDLTLDSGITALLEGRGLTWSIECAHSGEVLEWRVVKRQSGDVIASTEGLTKADVISMFVGAAGPSAAKFVY